MSDGIEVEVRLVTSPTGDPAILLQLPDGYVGIRHPEDALQVADALIAAASDLALEHARLRRRTTS